MSAKDLTSNRENTSGSNLNEGADFKAGLNSDLQSMSNEQKQALSNFTPEQLEKALLEARQKAAGQSEFVNGENKDSSLSSHTKTQATTDSKVIDPEMPRVVNVKDTNSLTSHLTEGDFMDNRGNPKLNLEAFMDELQNSKN